MPVGLDALIQIMNAAQAAKSKIAEWGKTTSRSPEYERNIYSGYTDPSIGDLPVAGVLSPRTLGAFRDLPLIKENMAAKLDARVGRGLGPRFIDFLEKHPRFANIYDDYKGVEQGVIDVPTYPRAPAVIQYKRGNIEAAEHEVGHFGQSLFKQPNATPPGFGLTLRGRLDEILNRLAGNYKPEELAGEVFPNFFYGGGKVTDKAAAAKWLHDATNLENIDRVRWGSPAPLRQKKVWEGGSFYETFPGMGYKWKLGDLTDPALRSPEVPKEFTGLISPELNLGAYSIIDPKLNYQPALWHRELLSKIRQKMIAVDDFDRPIQDLELDQFAHIRRSPAANDIYGLPSSGDDYTVIPKWHEANSIDLSALKQNKALAERHRDNVLYTLKDLNLIEPGGKPTYISREFYSPVPDLR